MNKSTVRYNPPQERYVRVSNSIVDEFEPEVIGIYCKLIKISYAKTLNIDIIAKRINVSEKKVRKVIVELEEAGYVVREPIKNEQNKMCGWDYQIYADPVPEEKRSHAGKKKQKTQNPVLPILRQDGKPDKTENGQDNIIIDNSISNNINKDLDNYNKKREYNKLSSPKKSGISRFVKPTIEEVDAYIKEKDYHFDAEQFWNHYESVGWMIGKNHMKDWHCACATWEGRRKREIKEKEDSEPSDARAPMDVEQWERNQRWMEENTPKYVGKISFDDFISMRGEVMLNSRIYGDILKEMHQSGYEGDIVAEFKRRNDKRICSHG